MNFYDSNQNDSPQGNTCLSAEILFFKSFRDTAGKTAYCPAPTISKMADVDFENSKYFLLHVLHILCTILPILFWFSLAYILTRQCSNKIQTNAALRFIIEFVIITVPTIFNINVANSKVEYIVAIMVLFMGYIIWQTDCLQKAKDRTYTIGTRPRMLTLGRATINFLTAFCILAIDFGTFPKSFRKTRRYGAGLMDTGIGLFVFAMGSVSKRAQRSRDFFRMFRIVVPLIVLGTLRTVIIHQIGYQQDDHEYGKHLNAFFTLGLTKLFGTLASFAAGDGDHLLPLGFAILTMHEFTLQLGIASYVMDSDVERYNFIDANREGLCSLPGFIGLYVLSMYLGHIWQTSEIPLKFNEFKQKIKFMALLCLTLWILTILSILSIGIARVTCNFGYAVWTLSIASIMIFLFMIMFDLVLDTLWPVEVKLSDAITDGGEAATLLKSNKPSNFLSSNSNFALPSLIEAVNMNGLVFFLIANLLTGGVNIFLKPENRTNFEGYFILFVYMLLSTSFVFVLFHRNIRIG